MEGNQQLAEVWGEGYAAGQDSVYTSKDEWPNQIVNPYRGDDRGQSLTADLGAEFDRRLMVALADAWDEGLEAGRELGRRPVNPFRRER